MMTVAPVSLDWRHRVLPGDEFLLRIWTPSFTRLALEAPVDITVEKARRFSPAQIRRGDPKPIGASERHWTLNRPLPFPDGRSYERVYALPPELVLEPTKCYRLSGRIRDHKESTQIFKFAFRTDSRGMPVPH